MGANAQTTVPTFTAGEVLTAAQMNNSARTGVPVFADTTARDAAFGGTGEKTLAEGQLCYVENLTGVAQIQYYDGSTWNSLSAGALTVVKSETAFSAASSVTADSVFSSTYTNYLMLVRYTTSTSNTLFMRFRVGGVSAATNYNDQYIQGQNTTVLAGRNTSATQTLLGARTGGDFKSLSVVNISGVSLAEPTIFYVSHYNSATAYTSPEVFQFGGNHSTATAYDGIELLVSTGTTTGSYTIYGYSK